MAATTIEVIRNTRTIVEVGAKISQQTEGGSGGAPQNVFIQQTDPALTDRPYAWFQTDAGGNIVTLWINTL